MAKSANQKGKLLAILEILRQESDEEHPIPMQQLIDRLSEQNITAERKSLYDDIRVLNELGYDVQKSHGRGYFLGERIFQLPELKLLVDAVQSSKFITVKKSAQLIEKLEKLTSRRQAQELQRQVFVSGRVKSMNESIYYSIDTIHQAIAQNRQVTFFYFKYNRAHEPVFRHEKALYQVSPFALLRSDDNYYMVAYDSKSEDIRHYRVDKMAQINLSNHRRDGNEAYQSFNLASYARMHFNMFRGPEADVTLRCKEDMADVIFDRFGEEVIMAPEKTGWFTCNVHAAVSPQFFGWLFGLGENVEIQSPGWVRSGMKNYLHSVLSRYE